MDQSTAQLHGIGHHLGGHLGPSYIPSRPPQGSLGERGIKLSLPPHQRPLREEVTSEAARKLGFLAALFLELREGREMQDGTRIRKNQGVGMLGCDGELQLQLPLRSL